MASGVASLARRLRFAGSARHACDRAAATIGLSVAGAAPPQRVPEKLAVLAFDALESVRRGSRVPSLGEPREAVFGTDDPIPQHPRYRGFWHDPERRSVVGLHLGVDLIGEGGCYHVIEMNLNAAMRPERRALYPDPIDPVFVGALETARSLDLERVVFFSDAWSDAQVAELGRAEAQHGIEARAWELTSRHGRAVLALPEPLPPRTLVVQFSGLHSPVDYFVHDKFATSRWLPDALAGADGVAVAPTHEALPEPDAELPACWPNLVVKLAGRDTGRYVALARVRSAAEAREAFRIPPGGTWPAVFRRDLRTRLLGILTGRDRVVFQRYVPNPLDEGRASNVRVHVLVTPLGSRFLSAHRVVAPTPLPSELPFGKVVDDGPYVMSFRKGAVYRLPRAEEAAHLAAAGSEIASAIERSLRAKFVWAPS